MLQERLWKWNLILSIVNRRAYWYFKQQPLTASSNLLKHPPDSQDHFKVGYKIGYGSFQRRTSQPIFTTHFNSSCSLSGLSFSLSHLRTTIQTDFISTICNLPSTFHHVDVGFGYIFSRRRWLQKPKANYSWSWVHFPLSMPYYLRFCL